MVDGELVFNTKIDQSGFDKGTRAVSSGISKLKGSLKSLGKSAAAAMPFSKGTAGIKNNISGVSAQLKSLAKTAAAAFSVKAVVDFAKASKEAYTVQEQQEAKLATIMKQRLSAADEDIDSVKRLASEQQKLGIIGDEVQLAGAQQVTTFLTQSDSIKTLLPAMNDLLAQQRGLEASTGDAVNIANLMGKVLQGQTSALKRVGISFSDAEEQVLKYGTESQRAAMLAQVITNNVGHMNQALAQTDAGKQKQLANTLGDVKEQFGQAVIQLESVFLPVIARAVDGLSKVASLAQTAASAFRSAFGVETSDNSAVIAASTASAVSEAADSYEDIAQSAEDTQKAQENSLASFDKVIKLNKQDTSGSSAANQAGKGAGGVSIAAAGKTASAGKSWADELKESIRKNDWDGLGKLLSGKINQFIDKVPWKNAGEKIGTGLTNAFTFAYSFLKSTKWKKLGAGFADFLNGIMNKTDFKLIGKTLGARLNALIGLAFGFVSTFNFAQAGLGLAQLINGWFNEVNWAELGDTLGKSIQGIVSFGFNFISNLDFAAIAADFATSFNHVLDEIDFGMLGQTVCDAFVGVWDFIATAIEEIDWENVGKKISEFLNGINWKKVLESLFHVIGSILKAAPELLKGVIHSLDFENAAGLFGLLFAPKMAKSLLSRFKSDPDVLKNLGESASTLAGKVAGGADLSSYSFTTKFAAATTAFFAGWKLGSWLYDTFKDQFDWWGEKLGKIFASGVTKEAEKAEQRLNEVINKDSQAQVDKWKAKGVNLTKDDFVNGTWMAKVEAAGYDLSTGRKKVTWDSKAAAKSLVGGAGNTAFTTAIQNNAAFYNKKIPKFATGTVVPANYGNFAAILGDNKREPEIVSPLSTMKQAVIEALASQGSQKQPVTINISLDTRSGKRLLSKEIIADINDITESTGKVPIKIKV